MTSKEDLIRESLELEAQFLEDLGQGEEAAKVRARVPLAEPAAHDHERSSPGKPSTPGSSIVGKTLSNKSTAAKRPKIYTTPDGQRFKIIRRHGKVMAIPVRDTPSTERYRRKVHPAASARHSAEEAASAERLEADIAEVLGRTWTDTESSA